MSALKCTKCDDAETDESYQNPIVQDVGSERNVISEKKGCILPRNPLDFNSTWSCTVHRQIEVLVFICKVYNL